MGERRMQDGTDWALYGMAGIRPPRAPVAVDLDPDTPQPLLITRKCPDCGKQAEFTLDGSFGIPACEDCPLSDPFPEATDEFQGPMRAAIAMGAPRADLLQLARILSRKLRRRKRGTKG